MARRGKARLLGRAVSRPRLRARGRPARAPDRGRAGDAQRVDRARAVHDAVVDVGRLRGALQPPRGRRRSCRGCCSSPAASPRAWRRSRSTGRPRGDSTAFALSLAATRIVLAAIEIVTGEGAAALQRRITLACLASALLFVRLDLGAWAIPLRAVGGGDRARVQRDAGRGPRGRRPCARRRARLERAAAVGPRDGARRPPLRRALRAVGLLLEEDPPEIAYGLACVGLGLYVASTRASWGARRRRGGAARVLGLIASLRARAARPRAAPLPLGAGGRGDRVGGGRHAPERLRRSDVELDGERGERRAPVLERSGRGQAVARAGDRDLAAQRPLGERVGEALLRRRAVGAASRGRRPSCGTWAASRSRTPSSRIAKSMTWPSSCSVTTSRSIRARAVSRATLKRSS